MIAAYKFAKEIIETKCHAKHLLLEPPLQVKVTDEFVQKINNLTHIEWAVFKDKVHPREKGESARSDRDVFWGNLLVVQKVMVAPSPNIIFGFDRMKWGHTVVELIPKFRKEILMNSTAKITKHNLSLKDLETKLESERKGIQCAIEHSGGSFDSRQYWFDLQGFLDLDGNYYHVDIDSQFWRRKKSLRSKDMYARKQAVIQRFNEMIQRLTDPPPSGVPELPKGGRYHDDDYVGDGDDNDGNENGVNQTRNSVDDE